MALPGVRTVLKDRFYTLSRTDAPDGITVAAIARRDNAAGDTTPNGNTAPQDYDAVRARSEDAVIDSFGDGSELHKAYLELVAGGAARVDLIALPAGADLDTEEPLENAFMAAEVAQSDIIVPWGRGSTPAEWDGSATPSDDIGFHADHVDFAQRVADHCRAISDRSNPCFAVMGVAPFAGTADTTSGSITAVDMASHLALPDLPSRDSFVENGRFLNVVATEVRPSGYKPEWGFANGAATYAGFISALDAEIAATGKALFNIRSLRYAPTKPQQQELVDKGVVPVALNYSRAAVVVDAQTFAPANSDYTRLSTLRIVYDAVQLIREACQKFIGMPATLEHRSSMDTAITDRLRRMTLTGAILDSDFTVTYVPRENKAIIDLVLRPAFEIRNIDVSVAVDLGG